MMAPPLLHDDPSAVTAPLLETLMKSRDMLDSFVKEQKARADAAAKTHSLNVTQEQASIDAHVETLLSVQSQRGLDANKNGGIAKDRTAMEEYQHEVERDIDKLQQEHKKKEMQLQGAYGTSE